MQIMFRYRHHTGDGREAQAQNDRRRSILSEASVPHPQKHRERCRSLATYELPRTPNQMDFACRYSHYYCPTDVTHRRPKRKHGGNLHRLSSAPAADTCRRVRRPITCRPHRSWRTLTTKTPARKPAQGAKLPCGRICTRRISNCFVETQN